MRGELFGTTEFDNSSLPMLGRAIEDVDAGTSHGATGGGAAVVSTPDIPRLDPGLDEDADEVTSLPAEAGGAAGDLRLPPKSLLILASDSASARKASNAPAPSPLQPLTVLLLPVAPPASSAQDEEGTGAGNKRGARAISAASDMLAHEVSPGALRQGPKPKAASSLRRCAFGGRSLTLNHV